jgi:hypothetical protein
MPVAPPSVIVQIYDELVHALNTSTTLTQALSAAGYTVNTVATTGTYTLTVRPGVTPTISSNQAAALAQQIANADHEALTFVGQLWRGGYDVPHGNQPLVPIRPGTGPVIPTSNRPPRIPRNPLGPRPPAPPAGEMVIHLQGQGLPQPPNPSGFAPGIEAPPVRPVPSRPVPRVPPGSGGVSVGEGIDPVTAINLGTEIYNLVTGSNLPPPIDLTPPPVVQEILDFLVNTSPYGLVTGQFPWPLAPTLIPPPPGGPQVIPGPTAPPVPYVPLNIPPYQPGTAGAASMSGYYGPPLPATPFHPSPAPIYPVAPGAPDFGPPPSNGANGNPNSSSVFNASGNFTVPNGVTSIHVQCTGFGADGAQGTMTSNPILSSAGGGGGGAGAYASADVATTPGTVFAITITKGSPTTFGSAISADSASGGSGGRASNCTFGAGTSNTIANNGGNGDDSSTINGGGGAGGGAGTADGNGINAGVAGPGGKDGSGRASGAPTCPFNTAGTAAIAEGGGGGGSGAYSSGGPLAAGAAGPGRVVVTWT